MHRVDCGPHCGRGALSRGPRGRRRVARGAHDPSGCSLRTVPDGNFCHGARRRPILPGAAAHGQGGRSSTRRRGCRCMAGLLREPRRRCIRARGGYGTRVGPGRRDRIDFTWLALPPGWRRPSLRPRMAAALRGSSERTMFGEREGRRCAPGVDGITDGIANGIANGIAARIAYSRRWRCRATLSADRADITGGAPDSSPQSGPIQRQRRYKGEQTQCDPERPTQRGAQAGCQQAPEPTALRPAGPAHGEQCLQCGPREVARPSAQP